MDDLDGAVDRILHAAALVDLPAPANPATDADIDALRAAVAPLLVPDELVRLYLRFQEGPPSLIDGYDLLSTENVIEQRQFQLENPDWPRALLPICYESHQFRLLELHDPDGTGGGAVWDAAYADDDLREVAPSLTALLGAAAVGWESGVASPYEYGGYRSVTWDFEAWLAIKARLLPAVRTVGAWPTRWLPRWLAIEGLDPHDAVPRGATATVASLRDDAAPTWTGERTLAGAVTSLMGSGEASSIVLDDGTGELLVYVPRSADPFRLLRVRSPLELDVVSAGDRAYAAPFAGPFEAVATAVRRDETD